MFWLNFVYCLFDNTALYLWQTIPSTNEHLFFFLFILPAPSCTFQHSPKCPLNLLDLKKMIKYTKTKITIIYLFSIRRKAQNLFKYFPTYWQRMRLPFRGQLRIQLTIVARDWAIKEQWTLVVLNKLLFHIARKPDYENMLFSCSTQ